MKHKLITLVLAVAVIASLVLIGCAPEAAPPEEEAAPPEEEAVVGEVYEWTMYTHSRTCWPSVQWVEEISPSLEAITNGRLKITALGPGEHPYAVSDHLTCISERICDILLTSYAYVVGTEPRVSVEDLPFLLPDSHEAKKEIHRKMLTYYYEEILDEWNCFELTHNFAGPQQLWLVEGWLETPDSLKGKRIRTWTADMDKVLGPYAIPVRIDPAEVYTSLQTKLVDGVVTGANNAYTSRLTEVVKHMVPINMFEGSAPIIVNKDAWNELPKEIQNAVLAYFDEKRDWYEDGYWGADGLSLASAITEDGLEVGQPYTGFGKEMREYSYELAWKPWAERIGEGGMDVLDKVVKIIREAGYEVEGYPLSR